MSPLESLVQQKAGSLDLPGGRLNQQDLMRMYGQIQSANVGPEQKAALMGRLRELMMMTLSQEKAQGPQIQQSQRQYPVIQGGRQGTMYENETNMQIGPPPNLAIEQNLDSDMDQFRRERGLGPSPFLGESRREPTPFQDPRQIYRR
jgi:hypothetical protein